MVSTQTMSTILDDLGFGGGTVLRNPHVINISILSIRKWRCYSNVNVQHTWGWHPLNGCFDPYEFPFCHKKHFYRLTRVMEK